MKLVLSYQAAMYIPHSVARCLLMTVKEYNKVITYVIKVVEQEWENIKTLKTANDMTMFVEKLIHATKNTPQPKYGDFDEMFKQLPSYLRRDAIKTAIGDYRSWNSNHQNWIENGKEGKEPRLTYERHQTPSFYNKNMFRYGNNGFTTIKLKLYDGKAWRWFPINIRNRDARYIQKKAALPTSRVMSPTIVKKGRKWAVNFAFAINSPLSDAKVYEQLVCAVDLGVNTDATCCIMAPDGTVLARKFFDFSSDKAAMWHEVNKIRKAQSKGARKLKRKWRRVNNMNEELSRKIVRAIVDFAVLYSCTNIVCEYLDIEGKKRGRRGSRQRLALWRKRSVYHHLCDQAHLVGMRVNQVCAWGTSRLAFDGSGCVERGRYITDSVTGESLGLSYSWVRFSSGKFYHADLNAAYNIGARYFIREILKSFGVTRWSADFANVLGLPGGSSRTLSDLISLNSTLRDRQVVEALAAVVAA